MYVLLDIELKTWLFQIPYRKRKWDRLLWSRTRGKENLSSSRPRSQMTEKKNLFNYQVSSTLFQVLSFIMLLLFYHYSFYYLFYCSQVLCLIMLLLLYHYSFYLLLVLTVARDTEDEDVLTARSAQGMWKVL